MRLGKQHAAQLKTDASRRLARQGVLLTTEGASHAQRAPADAAPIPRPFRDPHAGLQSINYKLIATRRKQNSMKTNAKPPFYSPQKPMFSRALSEPISASVSSLNSQLWTGVMGPGSGFRLRGWVEGVTWQVAAVCREGQTLNPAPGFSKKECPLLERNNPSSGHNRPLFGF